ncbi:MAG: tyrosine-type recombinase/integrase [Candidatus Moeniiplasma glomeromycotorum]|nr:tyrosine-type recombinase/integrase [Candidatus Moeniiplasma glomeromycotorum]MCE8162407.1 tyrosine-type recombinase/integrase [Candidatus Moeniiplasma glomeromycotorum]MCE8166333.1 tyrosine-type recombinase/integrase [Candidatus Moeniiplasma glomeromycotorum]MCE8166815.1 tyrosine-type recombinase/integrase [Candidatus Moeniiplasma glomeromycotorum]
MLKSNKKSLTILPTNRLLAQVRDYILSRQSKRGEHKRELMECLYLLGWRVGLRISEALNFDLNFEHQDQQYKNFYLLRGKGKKERWVYVGSEVMRELRQWDWKPNQTTRFTFSKFLEQVKKELNFPPQTELTPHTLRRCFATYQAISGMPLPVLQKVLGHSKVSTTALYVRDGDLGNLVKFRLV